MNTVLEYVSLYDRHLTSNTTGKGKSDNGKSKKWNSKNGNSDSGNSEQLLRQWASTGLHKHAFASNLRKDFCSARLTPTLDRGRQQQLGVTPILFQTKKQAIGLRSDQMQCCVLCKLASDSSGRSYLMEVFCVFKEHMRLLKTPSSREVFGEKSMVCIYKYVYIYIYI